MSDRQTLVGSFSNISRPVCRWCLNNHTFYKPSSPILLDTYFRTLDEEARNPLIFELKDGEVIDVLIQNARGLNGVSEQHPWHLHGHVRRSYPKPGSIIRPAGVNLCCLGASITPDLTTHG